MRVFAVLGIIVAAALGLVFFMLGRSADTGATASVTPVARPSATTASTRHTLQTPTRPTHRSKPRATHFQTPASGFPKAVDRAFRVHRVVVLVVYMPGSSVDAVVRKEARAGAIASGAGYVPVSALNGAIAGQRVAKTGVRRDPAVVVVKRRGGVSSTLGVTDRETVAQAVAQAKK
jgi:hypothetical protein